MTNLASKTLRLYKDSFSGMPREIWELAILTFINKVGTMVIPFLTVYLNTELKFSLQDAGFLVGGFGFGSFFGTFLGGKLVDKIGYRPIIMAGLGLSGIFLILLQFATGFYEFLALIFLAAFFGESIRPSVSAIVGEFVPKSQTGRAIALLRLAINLGFAAAPAIGGFVVMTLSYAWLFWIDGISCILAAVYFLIASASWKARHQGRANENANLEAETAVSMWRNTKFLLYLLATFILAFCFVQWFYSVPVFIKSEWGYDEQYIGMLMAMNGLLITFVEMPLVHGFERSGRIVISLRVGLIMIGISFLPFLLTKALWLCFLAMFFLTVGEILFLPFNNSQALIMAPAKRRGEYMAGYSMTWSLTHILGPTLGLGFVELFGFDWYWVALAVLVGIAFLFNVISREMPQPAPAPQ
ncbi:MAG: MFS transporter [Bacteroidia bacterium]|nr:MFS transporter [Bacteroidia bacterium]